ncbi:hypothetical protein [Pedobacter caeni]|uniref:Uncharacterized protein n=1 Tax=Pedobacter caeni TaxID=288992 RepID=A0A1M4U5A5_9SPHI|nr:hypothetical protein [Pedobacter caeni]SHE51826.1 hypothetical protein SAMN04488522_101434 [Pedobacter caeni]
MTNAEDNIKVISKNNSGFPEYLDFEKLRAEGIEHLGKLSGKIWTDHNVHDPGITILEVLCYALLDLGYRTNLPAKDLFTPHPSESGKDGNFFTPAQILACNPVTILDYRKLLIDIKGVKNAWLSIATDLVINGLYHVYIETEIDYSEEPNGEGKLRDLTELIKKNLMAHRNLCEDFADIHILRKFPVGVCAAIELKDGADPESVYLDIVRKLRDFLSPSPHFYTLQQLLDKGKSIDEIFAGRPYDMAESHGFVDTDELLQLKLKKEIHLSDAYNLILGIEGVQKVNKLELKHCISKDREKGIGWKFKLPENHIPEFRTSCSGFRFTRKGLPVELDTKKYEGLLNGGFENNGKALYTAPSPYLDKEIPKGIYHQDLDAYFLLQEDFPRVYGIAEGGLPEDASDLRKAQALQLKGYLLFFDQLLAGYLAQLKNIRSLFSMSSSGDPALQHTYFLNQLESLPELNPLLRFAVVGDEGNGLGKEGSVLLRTVPKHELDALITLNLKKVVDPLSLPPFTFSRLTEQQVAISELKEDLGNGTFTPGFLNKGSSCIYYYIISSSEEFALVSNLSFKTIDEANLHLNSVTYIGTFDENYRSFIMDTDRVSFSLELNTVSFSAYLQQIIEDKDLYSMRRNSFLDHLLSRFAEKFTDFALLSYNKGCEQQKSSVSIKAKENFLASYDEISSNRGRAYDYQKNKWNTHNTSGFENEAKFLSGIENKQAHYLCNFVVEAYDEQYLVDFKIAGETFFAPVEKFNSREEGEKVAMDIFKALSDPHQLKTQYIPHEKLYTVQVQYSNRAAVSSVRKYGSSREADALRNNFKRMFSAAPDPEDIFVSSFKYSVYLIDHLGDIVRIYTESFKTAPEAHAAAEQMTGKINDSKNWLPETKAKRRIGTLYFNKINPELFKFVDVKAFKIDINNTIVGRPDKFTYDLLDNANSFKFYPEKEFGTSKEARQHCYFVISLAGNKASYQVRKSEVDFKISLVYNDQTEASCYSEFPTEAEAWNMVQQIVLLVTAHEFRLKTEAEADGWKFNYRLGLEPASDHLFTSAMEYPSREMSIESANAFYRAIPSLQLLPGKEGAVLTPLKENAKIPLVNLRTEGKSSDTDVTESVSLALEQQKDILRLAKHKNSSSFKSAVRVDDSNGTGKFVYRLVDKDRPVAFYLEKYKDKILNGSDRIKVAGAGDCDLKYLQLCLGDDRFKEITDQTSKGTSYRFQLKAHNYQSILSGSTPHEIVFFESNMVYASKELAISAFEENYLHVLQLAAEGGDYAALVFIPDDTRIEIESTEHKPAEELIVKWAKSYPVKRVQYGSQAFNDLFCKNAAPSSKQVFYFGTFQYEGNPQQWQSVRYYDTPEETMKDFIFFLGLLRYAGNLYLDGSHCDEGQEPCCRIYIREVLAESTKRFDNENDAWGNEGVEKFICAVQSGFGFHHYQRTEDCCYTFYLNCGDDLMIHPCVYDTTKKRNEVLNELYTQFKEHQERNSYGLNIDDNELILLDENGLPFARQRMAKEREIDSCNALMELITQISSTDNDYSEEKGVVFLKDKSKNVILESYTQDYGLERWKETLRAFVCYFPLLKTHNEKTKRDHYSVELKLPGFSPCKDNGKEKDPCAGTEETAGNEPTCFVAWKSACSYSSCEEAMQVLRYMRDRLSDFQNYQPLVDCACNTFGIAINYDLIKTGAGKRLSELPPNSLTRTEKIAFNPQCYESAQLACAAVERTKRLSNAEGFHLIEHILLRPLTTHDKDSEKTEAQTKSESDCDYKWIVPKDDPCLSTSDICFVPGKDQYSFIATVVLPAWPQRFRTESGKMLMEDILYRLAPAHVMLRILWLAPHDFFDFEDKYKDWRKWMAKQHICDPEFSVSGFLGLLFGKTYLCLAECDSCKPCKAKEPAPNDCFEQDREGAQEEKEDEKEKNEKRKDELKDFLNQVNITFGWAELKCESVVLNATDPANKEIPAVIAPAANEARPIETAKDKATFINHRLESYESITAHIAEKLNKNAIVLNVQAFLKEKKPTIERFESIVISIIQNKKSSGKNAVALNKHQMLYLMQSVVGYTLDHFCFKKTKTAEMLLMSNAFEKMRKAKIDLSAIYNHWDGLEVKRHQPNLNIDEIKALIMGINKK